MRTSFLLILSALAGCIRSAPGPDLGKCADLPKGTFTYGQIGIGTCLAGPTDLGFHEADDETWLAVTNANPYLTFDGGSLLLINWDSIDLNADFNEMADLDAHAIDLPSYVGGLGILEDRQQAIVTSRFSPKAVNKVSNDVAYVIDLSDPTSPTLQSDQQTLSLRDDPQPVVVDEDKQLTYIGNLTDHSVAIIDHSGEQLERIDVAPGTTMSGAFFTDADSSGTVAEVGDFEVELPGNLVDDFWTLTYIDGLDRVWLPAITESDGVGLLRWSSGGFGYTPSALGVEIDPAFMNQMSTVEDPYVVIVADGLPVMFFATDGGIANMPSLGPVGDWDTSSATVVLDGLGAWHTSVHSPSLASAAGREALYYEGRSADGASGVGIAFSDDGLNWVPFDDPVIDPAQVLDDDGVQRFESIEDPYVRGDPRANHLRMWLSLFDGAQWTIGLTESAAHDGLEWSEIEEVLVIPGGDAAAPVVKYQNDRYILWFSQGDGQAWTHATAWSYDGREWFDITEIAEAETPYDLAAPPRAGVQVDGTGQWRLEGLDSGPFDALVVEGGRYGALTHGFSLVVASGHEVLNSVVPDNRAKAGILPGSLVEIDGEDTLFITEVGDDDRRRIGTLRRAGDTWSILNSDLIPAGTGGNVSGVTHPVVHEQDGVYTMFYGATGHDGLINIRRATSTDGLNFVPESGKVVNSDEDWDAVEQLPHHIEVMDDGLRLWYGGSNGSRFNIGAATASDPSERFTPEPGLFDPFQFGTGIPGSFDDNGVKDPVVFVDSDGLRHMFYAGYDGVSWHIGHAIQAADDSWERRADPTTDQSIPSMSGIPNTFMGHGAESPILTVNADGTLDGLYAGYDGATHRLGAAVGNGDEVLYPTQRFGTAEDTFTFTTTQGRVGASVIELAQEVENFITLGIGMSDMVLDSDRGFLYVPSKLATFVYVIDVRDDTHGVFDDFNFRDLEGLVRVETDLGVLGFQGALIDEARDRLYLTSRNPDGIVIMDLTGLEDNNVKETTNYVVPAALSLPSLSRDAGEPSLGLIGGAGMALTADGRYLLASHFRGNALIAFDLEMGAYGEEVRYLQHIGENPHIIQISPDGRYAVVANYVGDVIGDTSHSTLAVVDADPNSTTFLEVLTWIGNI